MLNNALAWYNAKGGVGKTTHTAHHAVSCALSGWRVLVVDLDPQGNQSRALGYVDDDRWDGGVGLQDAVSTRGRVPLTVMAGIRPNLDVIGGGPLGGQVASVLNTFAAHDPSVLGLFDQLLAPLAGEYDLILFDLPPTPSALHQAVLTTVHYLVVPVTPNPLAVDGLSNALRLWRERSASNPDLEVLAVVVGTQNLRATRARAELHGALADLPESIPVLEPPIRYSEAADNQMKTAGRVAIELEADLAHAKKRRLQWLANRQGPAPLAPSAALRGMADDYEAVLRQVNARFADAQQRWASRTGVA